MATYIYLVALPGGSCFKLGRHSGSLDKLIHILGGFYPYFGIDFFPCQDYIAVERDINYTMKARGCHYVRCFFNNIPETQEIWQMFKEKYT